MRGPLRLGIVGVGYMGRFHLQKALSNPAISVSALYDTTPSVVETLRSEGLPIARSYEELLERVDAVIISSPTMYHAEHAELAIRAQKHVLIEKPVTLTLQDLERLIALKEEAGVVALAGHVERFNPAFQALLPHRSAFSLFHFERIAPWTPRGSDASVVMDLLIHDLDLFWALTEGHASSICASAYKTRTTQADTLQVWIELIDGRSATFTISRTAPYKKRRILAHGTTLWAEADLLQKQLSLWHMSVDEEPKSSSVNIAQIDALAAEQEHFLQHILTNTPSTLSLEHVYSVMAWAQQVETLVGTRLVFTR